jgi:hypothetical protein
MTRIQFNTLEAPSIPLRVLLMSPYGGGKTYLIGYLSSRLEQITGKGMRLFDFDLGWQTLKSNGFKLDATSYVVDPNDMGKTWDEFDEDFHVYLDDPGKYSGFAIDSLSTLQGCAMDYVLKENKVKRRTAGRFQMTDKNDFGVLVTMLMQVLPQILRISSHSVFLMTAHTRLTTDEKSGLTKMLPAISGKALPSQIGGWFNEVYYLKTEGYRENVERLAQVMSDGQVDCKTQMANMPFELPVMAAIEKILIDYSINTNPSVETLTLLEKAGVGVV